MNAFKASILGFIGVLLLVSCALVFSSLAHAQGTTVPDNGQALEIGPPVLSLSADPGQTITADISLRAVSASGLIVNGQVNDFVADGEDGTPRIVLDTSIENPFSLRAWLSPLPVLNLQANEVKKLTITITVPSNASPGGYYGVVRFTGTPPELEGAGVSLSASLGTLILLKINGNANEQLSIEQFFVSNKGKPGSLFESAPIAFVERLKNTGNIQESPSGVVTVKDMFGRTVVTLGVNQPPRYVLPQSIRKFEQSVDESNIGNKILFGLYHADLTVKYGTNGQTVTSSVSFWVIPYRIIGAVIAGLIVIFFILRFAVKRYNNYIIGIAGRGNRR
jgi:hypothetical protein